MKTIGLFSGAGMLEKGFEQAGYDIVASNEINKIAQQTLHNIFDHDVLPESIHKLSVEKLRKDYGRIEAVIGGFPCQPYSTASDINGTRVRNLRLSGIEKIPAYSNYAKLGGALFLEFWRVAAILQPEVIVVENVPGMIGETIVMETFENTPCNNGKLPYYYNLFKGVFNARSFGLPQDRDRFFFIATATKPDGITNEKVRQLMLSIGASMQKHKLVVGDVLEDSPEIDIPDYVYARLAGNYRDPPIITVAGENAYAPTCLAHYAKDKGTRLVKENEDADPRPYTPLEYARLQGIPDDVEIAGSDTAKYSQIGNAVAVPVAKALATGIKRLVN